MEFSRKTLPDQHYLYVDREASMSQPQTIGDAMGSAFGEVFGFCGQNGVAPLSMPVSLYLEMPEGDTMSFRGCVFVSEVDAGKASGTVKHGVIPAGEVMTTVHVGPYSHLNVSHKALWDHVDGLGLDKAMPVWEHYVDDPTKVPEAECRTEIYRAIG